MQTRSHSHDGHPPEFLRRAPRAAGSGQRPAQQAGGSFQGERVHYVSVSQSLADAAEELTFAFSERAEILAKRRLSDAHARLSEVQAMLQEYWKRIPDLESQQKLEALIAHLGSGQLSSLAQLSAYLEGFSSEISQRFLALSRARDVLAGRPEARAMLALVDQALLRMADEQGLEIELGLRIEPLAAEASAAGVGDIQALRDTYRDAVLDYRGLSAAWQDIQERFAATPLERVGLPAESPERRPDSQSSRLDPVKLERVMSDMHKLRVLGGLAEQVGALWQVLVTGSGAMAYGPSELTGAVIALLEKRWVGVAEVQALLEPLPLADVARQIHFFRELKRLYRLLPVEVFGDDEQRQNLLNACQMALDLAIEREEEQQHGLG